MSASVKMRRAALLSPSQIVLLIMIGLPLAILAWISLLQRGVTSGVDWSAAMGLDNYVRLLWEEDFDGTVVFHTRYLEVVLRSVLLAVGTTLFCILAGIPAALWMASLPKRSRDLIILLITIPFWTSLLVRNYAWLIILRKDGTVSAFVNALIPGAEVGLLYTNAAIFIGLVYSFLPFMILPIYAVFEKFDWTLLEAAYDLGAGRARAFRKVMLPLAMPGVVAGAMLVFIPCLGAFVTPALLGGGKTLMIGNLIQLQFGPSRNWPFGASISIVLLALMMLFLMAVALWKNRRTQ
ncbi:MAG: ABC transporter permease [Sulfitobacter sp.]